VASASALLGQRLTAARVVSEQMSPSATSSAAAASGAFGRLRLRERPIGAFQERRAQRPSRRRCPASRSATTHSQRIVPDRPLPPTVPRRQRRQVERPFHGDDIFGWGAEFG